MSDTDPAGDRCELLPWDTEFWGFPVARLCGAELTTQEADRALKWCHDRDVRCLSFAADGSSAHTLDAATRAGFSFVDVRLELTREPLPVPLPTAAIACTRADLRWIHHLEEMAREAHEDTRFLKDPRFDRVRAAELYGRWITRDIREHTVLMAHEWAMESAPLGYISCQIEGPLEGHIGLVGVTAAARGRGVGRALVDAALRSFSDHSVGLVRVATQGTNVSAVRLYESAGFRLHETRIWFHRWFDPAT